jgi:ATP-binding cassette, subfamily B, bacterial MsbA
MNDLKRLLSYVRPYGWRIIIAIIASAVVGALDGAMAYMVGPLLQKIFAEKNAKIFSLLPFAVILLFVVKNIARTLNDYFIKTASQLGIQDLRNNLYKKLLSLNIGYYHRNPTGTLMGKIITDVGMMQESLANIVVGIFRDGLSVVTLLGVVVYRDWRLALVSFTIIPLTVLLANRLGKKMKRVAQSGLQTVGILTSLLQETFSGIKVIKAFTLEDREYKRFFDVNQTYYCFSRKAIKYEAISSPSVEAITSIGIAAVIWFGGSTVLQGRMSASDLLSFITAMVMMYSPVKRLLNSYNTVQRSLGAAERIFQVLDTESEIIDGHDAIELNVRVQGQVSFDGVLFAYDKELVLDKIDFIASPKSIVALVGPSGGGKSTLVSLLLRFYDVTGGAIRIDGTDIRTFQLKSLLKQIAFVDQETILFNDTIRNNILYGRSDATEQEVYEAARAAYAHEFILSLPDGYETNIGDRGVRLSGGQRQRVCIARALLKNSPILILDEATSALDTESEQMVQRALDNLMLNRTTFVIAHRLSTVLHADKIIVIDKGRIVEQGCHDELVKLGGVYNRLYSMQFKDSEQVLS